MRYTCPVCFWPGMDALPDNHEICSCCGTHFDYEDAGLEPKPAYWPRLRQGWIAAGMPWFSDYTKPPEGWNPSEQVGTGLREKEAINARYRRLGIWELA